MSPEEMRRELVVKQAKIVELADKLAQAERRNVELRRTREEAAVSLWHAIGKTRVGDIDAARGMMTTAMELLA